MDDKNKKLIIKKIAEALNPIDDIMFTKMAEDRAFCQEMLQVILQDKKLVVIDHKEQKTLTNLKGRSARIDAYCELGNGKKVTVEVQRSDDDNHQRRVRYTTSLLTVNITDTGTKFEQVPDVIGIFISKFDIFKGNRAIYHIERQIKETGQILDNGLYEIYVNASAKDGSEVSDYMKIFVENDAYDDRFPNISNQKRIYKQSVEGKQIMNELLERLKEEGREEGVLSTLFSLVNKGLLSLQQAADQAGLSESDFKKKLAI